MMTFHRRIATQINIMGMELHAEQSDYAEMENVEISDTMLFYHVRGALKSAVEGDPDKYKQLVTVMGPDERLVPEKVALMVTCLKALSGSVSCLDIVHHQSLISSILKMSMWNYGTDVMDALMELVISLATFSGQYVDLCLEMLVSNFMPPDSFISLLNQSRGILRKGQVIDHVHKTLIFIAELVPLSPLRLERIITERMPHIFTKEPLILIYVENMLKLESGEIGDRVGRTMLLAVMDRLIDLDVDIAWDDILQEDFTKGIFDMELEDLEGPVDVGQQDGDELRISWMERYFSGNLNAQKLDSLMVLTFEHLNFCKESGRLRQVFDTLLQSFQLTVLTAYKSKFAQFVLFYACSLDPENCGRRFADTLFHKFKTSRYPEWRMSAVAYLASYLARAKFLPISFVAEYLESLLEWCSIYCSNQSGGINPKAHKEFYAACQAMMYVLCFRMRSVLAVPHIRSRISKHIEDILRHPLSPLMVCLPSIVEEFLRLAKVTRLDVPDNFVSSNLLESELSMAFGGRERLDMFFPFDPCLLMRSDRFIRPNFVYWSMVRSSYDNDEDDNEGTSDEDEIEICTAGKGMNIANDGAARSYDQDLDEFDNEMSKMSITPKVAQWFGGELRTDMQMPSRIRPCPDSL
ncbi:hypothetical protein CQW23_04744 [Capsicum baccatum]|uniref:RNA polymerase I-specific transcription initiation factor RRN3 n=1 Tax=Capsicum baccatum TaxID=33114 RepID=A0A2G2XFI7_CAPBA|nr:hypothetical protein CQW23_04744 [Capsicum baccatum]